MNKEDIKIGQIVEHKNGNKYYIFDVSIMENPDGEWIPCVVYLPLYECEYKTFVRSIDSFIKSFKIIKQ